MLEPQRLWVGKMSDTCHGLEITEDWLKEAMFRRIGLKNAVNVFVIDRLNLSFECLFEEIKAIFEDAGVRVIKI